MLELRDNNYSDWKDFFHQRFDKSSKFRRIDLGIKGNTHCEKYISTNIQDKTEIIVGYLNDTLIYLKFYNPLTIGFNKLQDNEHFYKYDYTPDNSYGDPGLEFNEINLVAIDRQLMLGIKGTEIQTINDDKVIKSVVSSVYNKVGETYPITFYFDNSNFLNRLLKKYLKKQKQVVTTKEIDLRTIFEGLG